jgi:hypothetical protein
MKRITIFLSLIFALAIALSASIPTLAASDSGTTVISGTLAAKIEVTAPSAISLTLDPDASPETGSSVSDGHVKSNKAWTLTASDLKETGDGYMTSVTASTALDTEFQINLNGEGLTGAAAGDSIAGSPGNGLANDFTFAVSQAVTWEDAPADDYTITITFVGNND